MDQFDERSCSPAPADFVRDLDRDRGQHDTTGIKSLRPRRLRICLTDCENFHIINTVVPGPSSLEFDPRGLLSPDAAVQRKTVGSPSHSFHNLALLNPWARDELFSKARSRGLRDRTNRSRRRQSRSVDRRRQQHVAHRRRRADAHRRGRRARTARRCDCRRARRPAARARARHARPRGSFVGHRCVAGALARARRVQARSGRRARLAQPWR